MEKLTTAEMFQRTQSYGSTPDETACFIWSKLTGNLLRSQYILDKGLTRGPEDTVRYQEFAIEAQKQLDELAEIYPPMPERIPVWEATIEENVRRFNEARR